MSCAFFLVHFCFYFLLFNMSLYVLGRITYLANTLVHKNFILCIWMCACTNEPPWTHLHTHMCLETHRMRDMSFFFFSFFFSFFFLFWYTIFIVMLMYIFLGQCVVHLLLLGCVAAHTFLWDIFWKLWVGFGTCLVQTRDPNGSRDEEGF